MKSENGVDLTVFNFENIARILDSEGNPHIMMLVAAFRQRTLLQSGLLS